MKKYFISYFIYHTEQGNLKWGVDSAVIWSRKKIDNEIALSRICGQIIQFHKKKYNMDFEKVKIIFFKKISYSQPPQGAIVIN